jgi:hypothetical protein
VRIEQSDSAKGKELGAKSKDGALREDESRLNVVRWRFAIRYFARLSSDAYDELSTNLIQDIKEGGI